MNDPSRTKTDIYNDAHLSFHFAMRNGIFMGPGPLTNETQDVFEEFLLLAKNAVPPTWILQRTIGALLDNFDSIVQDESHLLAVVDRHPPPVSSWSSSCHHGETGEGYTCGLWELFHIMTVGVVEYNRLVPLDAFDDIGVGTADAAVVIRNYIHHFFGCEVCRHNFIEAFDACKYDHCTKLNNEHTAVIEWIEFPLWLWKTHNAVNVRLLHERNRRKHLPSPTLQEEQAVQYPSRLICPRCWQPPPTTEKDTDTTANSADDFDKEKIFMYLRIDYWPDDSTTDDMRASLFLDDNKNDSSITGRNLVGNSNQTVQMLAIQMFPIAVIVGILVAWYAKRAALRQTGLPKKIG
jgi:hypothetical protein